GALDYTHNFNYVDESDINHTGVIHRDVKPSNLLLDTKGRLKITDFGIAKVVGEKGVTGTTQFGSHPGTIEYMSPEQLRGGEIDKRSDIYSMGVTFYEMLSGRLPFELASIGSDRDIRRGQNELEPTAILERRPDLPPALAALVMRAVRRSPSDRYQSANDFLDALRPYEQQQAANGVARISNGRTSQQPLIVATDPEQEPARPARPSQVLLENSTVVPSEFADQPPVAVPTKIVSLSQAIAVSTAQIQWGPQIVASIR